jgi:hypothetical protein
MPKITQPGPQEIFEALCAKSRSALRLKNLEIIHNLCQAQSQGSNDFSKSTIGRLSEAAGGISRRALYNAASGDFLILIRAWEQVAKKGGRPSHFVEISDGLLAKIDDAAIRALVQAVILQRDRLAAEVNLLKASSRLVVDRRPLPSGTGDQVPSAAGLTASEAEAVQRVLVPGFLVNEGWEEGRHGEVIVAATGRRLFQAGFLPALRKMTIR